MKGSQTLVSQTLVKAVLAAAALGFLAAMALTGAQPVQRQLAAFEPKGVLKIPSDRIRRVRLGRGANWVTLVRTGEKTWSTPDGLDIGDAGERISVAVQMMHTSGPARVMAAEELAGVALAEFELDAPLVEAMLYESGEAPVLAVRFGARNPDGFLQYMQIEGDRAVYLMSRFVGERWREARDRMPHR
jgi:hypothetical protein